MHVPGRNPIIFVYSQINFLLVDTQVCVFLDRHKNNFNSSSGPSFVFSLCYHTDSNSDGAFSMDQDTGT